jgi:hypothetical protein
VWELPCGSVSSPRDRVVCFGSDRTDGFEPREQTYGSAHDALDLPMLRRVTLLTFPQPAGSPQLAITELEPLHAHVLALLGPPYEKRYKLE